MRFLIFSFLNTKACIFVGYSIVAGKFEKAQENEEKNKSIMVVSDHNQPV